MPLYSYMCQDHGEFDAWRSMREASEPSDCPTCRTPAPRAVSAPSLALMNPANRTAHNVNEKSADSPQVMQKKHEHGEGSGGHGHNHAHGHGHGHSHGGIKHAHGPSRPWMIGH